VVNGNDLEEQTTERGPFSVDALDQAIDAILVADCGSSFTRVSLLERVETGFSFIAHAMAPTTTEPPWSDVSAGVRHAIEQITDTTGWSLLDDTGTLMIPRVRGAGVDLFLVTCSAGRPLRVVLAGLMSQVSLASLERAASGSYVEVLGSMARDYANLQGENQLSGVHASAGSVQRPDSLEDLPSSSVGAGPSDEDKIAIIRQLCPDVVWVVGGTDGGSHEPVRDLVETVALACKLVDSSPQPAMVYAGNAALRSEIVELIGEEVEMEVVDNVRPALDTENLAAAQAAFQAAYVRRKVQRLPGMGTLAGWSGEPILSTAQSTGFLVRYLERLYASGKGVLCADMGSVNTTIAASLPAQQSTSRSGPAENGQASQQILQVVTSLGMGYGAPTLLERVGLEAIIRWLPFETEPGEVEQVLMNKGIQPITIPPDRRQLLIEQAAAREALRLVMRQVREIWRASPDGLRRRLTPLLEPIIASGGTLVHTPRPSQAVLMLLDSIEPIGISTVLLDEYGVASALGAVAVTHPLAAVQALDAGGFSPLGTIVAPVGRARPGEVVLRAKVSFQRGAELAMEVKHGSLEVLPLQTGEKAMLELRPRRGFRIGRVGRVVEVNGGTVGLVIDARGRPLHLPPNLDVCRQLAQQWLWEMGA
jgi:hypothetical protein